MIRQDPESYDQDKDSPLIGGYGNRELVHTRVIWPENEYAHGVKTSDLIGLLEQAAEEFPKQEVTGGWGEGEELPYYDADDVDAWKLKWLTVPPVCG